MNLVHKYVSYYRPFRISHFQLSFCLCLHAYFHSYVFAPQLYYSFFTSILPSSSVPAFSPNTSLNNWLTLLHRYVKDLFLLMLLWAYQFATFVDGLIFLPPLFSLSFFLSLPSHSVFIIFLLFSKASYQTDCQRRVEGEVKESRRWGEEGRDNYP